MSAADLGLAAMTGTPRALGYRMPAEWERHAATWLAWPHNAEDWPGKFQPIPWVYAEIVRHLTRVEDVHILVNDAAAEKRARGILQRAGANLGRAHFHIWLTDRVWTRDAGPIFLRKGAQGRAHARAADPADTAFAPVAVTNWKFNAWAKYPNWHHDDKLPALIAEELRLPQWTPIIETEHGPHRVVLEGGSIDVNGQGTLITTEECLLSEVQERNPGVSREQLEGVFHDYLGIDQVLWMNRGIAGDDTHGHVDDIVRFAGPNTIVAVVEPSRDDENHLPLQENLERLRAARNPEGKPFEIVELPMPEPVVFEGQRLPASYANFYVANDLVIVPTLNDSADRKALNILAQAFPTREVVGIYCGDLIWGLGALHCMTQQQPDSAAER
ncbi:MAG TPA: agmatine deiminase family protein [Acidobacteriaceae bacterium]|jgi:agmatine deiminase|nr:agmatine deiminase family protein [Acidobacteriaceae bacterium]